MVWTYTYARVVLWTSPAPVDFMVLAFGTADSPSQCQEYFISVLPIMQKSSSSAAQCEA
jgi:hypothetical protein